MPFVSFLQGENAAPHTQNQSAQQTEATWSRQKGLLSCNSGNVIGVQENLQQTVNYFSDSSSFLILEMQHLRLSVVNFPGKCVPQRIRKWLTISDDEPCMHCLGCRGMLSIGISAD